MNLNPDNIKIIAVIAVIVFLYLYSSGTISDKKIKKNMEKERKRAQHTQIPKEMLKRVPAEGDFILGKDSRTKKYYVWDTNKAPLPHVACLASSGGGKTSTVLLPFVLLNPKATCFVIDLKNEIGTKGVFLDSPNVAVVQPDKKYGYGFDVFATLSEASTDDEVYEVLQTITLAVIPTQKGDNSFWSIEAQALFLGLLLYYYNEGHHNLIEIIDCILSDDIKAQVQEAMNVLPQGSKAFRCLVQFENQNEETFTSVTANMCQSLQLYSNDSSIRWLFSDSPLKVSYKTLEAQRSIYLCIPDAKLEAWNSPICVVISLLLQSLTYRSEDSHQIYFLLDELGSVVAHNGLPQLVTSMQIMRSRRVSILMFLQQVESLRAGFTEEQTTTILGNCGIKICLDSSSPKTQELMSKKWAPVYISRKQSKSSGKNKSNSTSFSYEEVVKPSEMMSLVKNNEAIVITPMLPFATVQKVPYYKDTYLKPIADKIREHNEKIKGR